MEAIISQLNILFWNIKNNRLARAMRRLADRYNLNLIILSECLLPDELILDDLNEARSVEPFRVVGRSEFGIAVISNLRGSVINVRRRDRRAIFFTVDDLLLNQYTICALHIPSKMFTRQETQAHAARELVAIIRQTEEDLAHDRTIVVGDFNMNPFEEGMIVADGFHASPSISFRDDGLTRQSSV